jgi:hypothetical protein
MPARPKRKGKGPGKEEDVTTRTTTVVVAMITIGVIGAAWVMAGGGAEVANTTNVGKLTAQQEEQRTQAQLLAQVRALQWRDAEAAATKLSQAGHSIPPTAAATAIAATAVASLAIPGGLGGMCTGKCGSVETASEGGGVGGRTGAAGGTGVAAHADFEQFLSTAALLSAAALQRSSGGRDQHGWGSGLRVALMTATRSRHLLALKVLAESITNVGGSGSDSDGGRGETGAMAAVVGPPLLQLAVTTRSEVTSLSRLLLGRSSDARRKRAASFLRSVGGSVHMTLATLFFSAQK